MNRALPLLPLLLALSSTTTSCTRAELAPVPPPDKGRADNKLTVDGRFCTTDPDDLDFPVKLLFLIDSSASMNATDPEGARIDALVDVIDSVYDVPGVEIAILPFSGGVQPATFKCDDYDNNVNCRPGFVPPEIALESTLSVGEAAGTTDFISTLNSVVSFLATDMAGTDVDDLQNARYAIIFLSDGLPDADGTFDPVGTCRDAADWERAGETIDNAGVVTQVGDLLEQVTELARQYDVRELTFNTAFAAAPDTQSAIKACGSTFMRAMANQGAGVFRDFSSGEAINFLFIDFTSFKRVFAMKSFLATNLNAAPFSAALNVDFAARGDDPTLAKGIIDSDADGLPDEIELLIGSDPQQQDTDGDGFSDLLESRLTTSGLDPLDPTDADCAADVDRLDQDGDGLRDCEERFFGTIVSLYDTDNDGFGDGVELMFGLNPAIDDTVFDTDFDGVRNSNELRAHSRIDTDDVIQLSEHAYRYKIVEDGLEGSSLCYTFSVDNISLASTNGSRAPDDGASSIGLGGGEMLRAENRILFEVTEEPFDAPGERGVARLACARTRFDAANQLKEPANGLFTLPPTAFVPADEFDPLIHCVDP
ncbi:MAG TPA: hypothetical protein VGF99_17410 [Myxococcota bacterium]